MQAVMGAHGSTISPGFLVAVFVLVYVSAIGCSPSLVGAPTPVAPRTSSITPQEKAIRSVLAGHALNHAFLCPVRDGIDDCAKGMLDNRIRYTGVNADAGSPGVSVYLVDQKEAQLDKMACGPLNDDFSLLPEQVVICRAVRDVGRNCAVLGPNTVACDIDLLWRLMRTASWLSIASVRDSSVGKYWFDKDELRVKFLRADRDIKTTEQELANWRVTEESFNDKFNFLGEVRARVLRGFTSWLISHEFGHVILGHGVSGASSCALAAARDAGELCNHLDEREKSADEYALEWLGSTLDGSTYTPVRASPELFIEEFLRRSIGAMLDAGLDPLKWEYEKAPQAEKGRFEEFWIARMKSDGHPYDLDRYLMLLDLLEGRGVKLTSSEQTRLYAKEQLAIVRSYCSKPHD